jgi:hypothetical protein
MIEGYDAGNSPEGLRIPARPPTELNCSRVLDRSGLSLRPGDGAPLRSAREFRDCRQAHGIAARMNLRGSKGRFSRGSALPPLILR